MFDKIENGALKRRVKDHVIGRDHEFFAVVQPGFELTASGELAALGLSVKSEFIEGGVEFTGRLDSCYRACLLSRTATRITMRLASFRSSNFYELERQIRNFPWELYLPGNTPFNFRTSASKSMIYHTGKLEEIFNLCINDRLAKIGLIQTSDDNESGQTILLRNHNDLCTVSLDASGEFLYKRGSGKNISRAPLRETTAALILLEAGIENYDTIIDPMCGAGTFSIEAASILLKIPAAADRKFPFMNWPCFKEGMFRFIKNSAVKAALQPENLTKKIHTSDIDTSAVEAAIANVPDQLRDIINPDVLDFFSIPAEVAENGRVLIVMNPPYGKRIADTEVKKLYSEIGSKIRRDFPLSGYVIIAPGTENEDLLGLEYDRKIPFMNGGIKVAAVFKHI